MRPAAWTKLTAAIHGLSSAKTPTDDSRPHLTWIRVHRCPLRPPVPPSRNVWRSGVGHGARADDVDGMQDGAPECPLRGVTLVAVSEPADFRNRDQPTTGRRVYRSGHLLSQRVRHIVRITVPRVVFLPAPRAKN